MKNQTVNNLLDNYASMINAQIAHPEETKYPVQVKMNDGKVRTVMMNADELSKHYDRETNRGRLGHDVEVDWSKMGVEEAKLRLAQREQRNKNLLTIKEALLKDAQTAKDRAGAEKLSEEIFQLNEFNDAYYRNKNKPISEISPADKARLGITQSKYKLEDTDQGIKLFEETSGESWDTPYSMTSNDRRQGMSPEQRQNQRRLDLQVANDILEKAKEGKMDIAHNGADEWNRNADMDFTFAFQKDVDGNVTKVELPVRDNGTQVTLGEIRGLTWDGQPMNNFQDQLKAALFVAKYKIENGQVPTRAQIEWELWGDKEDDPAIDIH